MGRVGRQTHVPGYDGHDCDRARAAQGAEGAEEERLSPMHSAPSSQAQPDQGRAATSQAPSYPGETSGHVPFSPTRDRRSLSGPWFIPVLFLSNYYMKPLVRGLAWTTSR